MKNTLLNKAVRLILGVVSILPQKESRAKNSNTNTPAAEAPSEVLPQVHKNLKPKAIKSGILIENLKSSDTNSAQPTRTAKEEKSEDCTSKKINQQTTKDSVETKTRPNEKQEEINKETEKNIIYRSNNIAEKTSKAATIPLSALGLSVQLFNCLRASHITTVDNLVSNTSEELLQLKGVDKFGVIEIIMSLNKLEFNLKDSPSVDLIIDEPAASQPKQKEGSIETKTPDLAANPEILEVTPKSAELNEQELIKAIEISFKEYCAAQSEATTFISSLKEIIAKDNRLDYAQKTLQYILASTQSFFDLYGGKYDHNQTKKIKIAIALITKKKADALIRNPKNSHLMRAIESHCKPQEINGFHYVLRSLAGETLYEIGSTSPRKQNSHMVRQKLTLASRVLLINNKGFQRQLEQAIKLPVNKKLEDFFAENKRLPTPSDFDNESAGSAIFAEIKNLNLAERILKLEELSLPLQEEEYDYHYDAILSNTNEPGNRYWLELENIAQFLKRHAMQIGEPTLMPRQVQLPHSVRGAVTRFGGQAFVASKVGLIYQGQLVGEDGRTFWTKEKIDDLFGTIRSLKDESDSWTPSTDDIRQFLKLTDLEEYKNLRLESLMAAIKREDIALVEVENENLYEIEVSDETTEQPIAEEIPKQHTKSDSSSSQKEIFKIDDKRANELKELDDEVRGRLNKIFSTSESDSEMTDFREDVETSSLSKNDEPRNLKLDEAAIRSILFLLRDNEEDEYVKSRTLEDISAGFNLTISLVFDRINEIALSQTDTLLLEEEDEENYYIDIDVLNSLLSSFTS